MAQVLVVDGIHKGKVGEQVGAFHDSTINQRKYIIRFDDIAEVQEVDLRYVVPATTKEIEKFEKTRAFTLLLNEAKSNGNIEKAKEIIAEIKSLNQTKKK